MVAQLSARGSVVGRTAGRLLRLGLVAVAGWGLPQNSITFTELAGSSGDPAGIMIRATLADTTIGRGWGTVGHAPGLYRNRISLRRLR